MTQFRDLHHFLVGKSNSWMRELCAFVLSEWLISPERWRINSEDLGESSSRVDLETAIQSVIELPVGMEREKFLTYMSHIGILQELGPTQPVTFDIPDWKGRDRCEAKIKARRGMSQDKILLAVGVLSGGETTVKISSGDVKKYLRRDLSLDGLADDATTFLTKLAESGDLRLLPERKSRNETVFEMTDSGSAAIRELLL